MDDRGRTADRTRLYGRRTDRRDGNRRPETYGDSLCAQGNEPRRHYGHPAQTGSCRHHDLLSHGGRTLGFGLRNDAFRRCDLSRSDRTLDAPCRAHRPENRLPGDGPLEQHGRHNRHGNGRGVSRRRDPIPCERHRRVAGDAKGRAGRNRTLHGRRRPRMDELDQRRRATRQTSGADQGRLCGADLRVTAARQRRSDRNVRIHRPRGRRHTRRQHGKSGAFVLHTRESECGILGQRQQRLR